MADARHPTRREREDLNAGRVRLHAEPLPDSALEAIVAARDSAKATERSTGRLLRQLEAMHAPARPELLELTAAVPKVTSNARETSASIGVINKSAEAVWLGLGGLPATAANGYPIPANRIVVLPLAAEDVEVAADPAPAGRIVVVLLRFEVCQPTFIGSLA